MEQFEVVEPQEGRCDGQEREQGDAGDNQQQDDEDAEPKTESEEFLASRRGGAGREPLRGLAVGLEKDR